MEIFFQSTACQKVPLLPTVKEREETEEVSPEHQELQPSSSVTPMISERPDLDSHPELERLSSEDAELWLVLPPVVEEQTSHS